MPKSTLFERARIHLVLAREELAELQQLAKKRPQNLEDSRPSKKGGEELSQDDINTRVLLSMAEWSHILELRREVIESEKTQKSRASYVNLLKKNRDGNTITINLHDNLMVLNLENKERAHSTRTAGQRRVDIGSSDSSARVGRKLARLRKSGKRCAQRRAYDRVR